MQALAEQTTQENELSNLRKIGYSELKKLLKKADSILSNQPEGGASYDKSGWTLTLIERNDLKVGGRRVGEHRTYHTIFFPRGGFADRPEHRADFDYGTARAIKLLFADELRDAEKHNREPRLSFAPKHFSKNENITILIPSKYEDSAPCYRTVYLLCIGEGRYGSINIDVFGDCESAHNIRTGTWPDKTEEHYDRDCTRFVYVFSKDADSEGK